MRVDQYLEEGVSEDEVDRWVRSASLLHSNGDALNIAAKNGRIVGVRGRAVDQVNKGRLDPKDLCPASRPRHALIGHAVAVGAGAFALAVFGLLDDPSVLAENATLARIGAGALSVVLTGVVLLFLNLSHPPSGATTLIVSLGFLQTPPEMAALLVGVVLLTALGWLFNRAAGVPVPVWSAGEG